MFFISDEIQFPSDLSEDLRQKLSVLPPLLPKDRLAFQKLWPKLAKEGGVEGKNSPHYSESPLSVELYLRHYLPAYVLKLPLVLEEAHLLGLFSDQSSVPVRWMDLGSGPGTSLWGLEWWVEKRWEQRGERKFLGLEQSSPFLSVAKRFLPSRRRFTASWEQWRGESLVKHLDEFSPTHISMLHSLKEIAPSDEEKETFLRQIEDWMIRQFRKDGMSRWLILIEPGTRENFRALGRYRSKTRLKSHLPCTDLRPCGAMMKETDWCHHIVNVNFPDWYQEESDFLEVPKSQLIFSYLVLSTRDRPSHWPDSLARMVSQRLDRKGQRECYFCLPTGKTMGRAQKSKAPEHYELFSKIRRGSLWSPIVLGPKGDWESGEEFAKAPPTPLF